MAIAWRGTGGGVSGINNLTPTVSAAQLVGDMMILIANGKPYNLGWSVATSGWASLGRGQSGTTAAGVDVGSMTTEVWYKEALVDPETDPTVTEDTPVFNVANAIVLVFSKDASEAWETPVVVFGADETNGTDISVTYASDPGVAAGDWVIADCGMNTDALGPLTAALTPAQTGVTFGATTVRREAETASGGDMSMHSTTTPVTSGTSSAAPTATGTGTASGGADRLESAFIRLRVSAIEPVTVVVAEHLPFIPMGRSF